jgi:NAD-dependent SIR2 family protein deacetylase
VTIRRLRGGMIEVRCRACSRRRETTTMVEATEHKRAHRCPPGCMAAFPRCPTCGSTRMGCKELPRGQWHISRKVAEEKALQGRPGYVSGGLVSAARTGGGAA